MTIQILTDTEPFHGRSGAAENADTPNCNHISGADAPVSTTWNYIRLITQSQPPNGSLSSFLFMNFMAVSQAATVLFWSLASFIFLLSTVSQQIACFYERMLKSSRYYAYFAILKHMLYYILTVAYFTECDRCHECTNCFNYFSVLTYIHMHYCIHFWPSYIFGHNVICYLMLFC